MTNMELQDNLPMLLMRTYMPVKQEMLRLSEKHDLTLMQAYAMCVLEPHATVPTNSLSNYLWCDPSNITGVVDRLVAGGYLERGEHPTDRRVKTITLTAKGQKLRQDFYQQTALIAVPGLSRLAAAEQTEFQRLLVKIQLG